jgi:hypothetical protein
VLHMFRMTRTLRLLRLFNNHHEREHESVTKHKREKVIALFSHEEEHREEQYLHTETNSNTSITPNINLQNTLLITQKY